MKLLPRRRIVWLLALGAIAIVLAAGYVHYWLYLPVGTGPAGPDVAAEPFAKPWTERPIALVGVGDSVTAGLGSTAGHSYFERIVKNPDDEFPDMRGKCLSAVLPNLQTTNIAVSGSNSLQHLAWVTKHLPVQSPDVFGLVLMTSGGNDLIHWYGRTPPREAAMYGATLAQAQPWIANYQQRMDQIFTLLEARFPGGCLIFVANIYDPSDGYGNPQSAGLPAWPDCLAIHAAYNAALVNAAAGHSSVCLVPMQQAFLGHGIHCRKFWTKHYRADDPHYWYAFNLEDPNNRGYDALRRVFLNEIIQQRERIAK